MIEAPGPAHLRSPPGRRVLLGGGARAAFAVGVLEDAAALASCLLFEGEYTRRWIERGCADTLTRSDEVRALLFKREPTGSIQSDAAV